MMEVDGRMSPHPDGDVYTGMYRGNLYADERDAGVRGNQDQGNKLCLVVALAILVGLTASTVSQEVKQLAFSVVVLGAAGLACKAVGSYIDQRTDKDAEKPFFPPAAKGFDRTLRSSYAREDGRIMLGHESDN